MGETDDPDAVQVDVAFLSYLPEGENNGNARLDSISYVTLQNLLDHETAKRKKKTEMGKNAYKHFKWVSDELCFIEHSTRTNIHIPSLPQVYPGPEGGTDGIGTEQKVQDRPLAD